jgi:hypothetical protein
MKLPKAAFWLPDGWSFLPGAVRPIGIWVAAATGLGHWLELARGHPYNGQVSWIPAPLARILALVLLFQAALAPALCIGRAQAHTIVMEICGPEGMRSMPLALDDQAPAQPGEAHGFCAVCAAMPQGAQALTPALPVPAWLAIVITWPGPNPAALPPQARAPPALA